MSAMATFVGRHAEHHEIAALLDGHRVVTLVGPGGVGKTRLATELSIEVADRYPGGVLFCELTAATEHDDVGNLIAAQHGFPSVEALRLAVSEPTLVVLDNCETVLRQASTTAEGLVDDNDTLTVLATSRAPLQIYGERIFVVDPLGLPHADGLDAIREAAATRLFLDRAEAVGAPWSLDDDNLVAIGHLVAQLDGLPLAIELAAARSRLLAPTELVEHLDRQLDLLARPTDGATARHSSLRSAIQTSYEPLSEDLQRFFRAISIFSAPFDLDLAHAVAGPTDFDLDTLDLLGQLVETSLVDTRPDPSGATRYRLLDSIRAYGREQLTAAEEFDAQGERYAAAMRDFAADIVAQGLEAFSPAVLGQIRDRFVHLTHAIEWCIDHDTTADRAYQLFIPMYGPTGSRADVAGLGRRMCATWEGTAPLQAEAYAVLATAAWLSGDNPGAVPVAEDAIDHPDGSPLARMIGHRVLGFIAASDGDAADAMDHLHQAVELARPFSASFARELTASWAAVVTDPARNEEMLDLLTETSADAEANDELITVMWAQSAISNHHWLRGDTDEARRAAERALAVARDSSFPWAVGAAHRMMGSVLAADEGWEAAAPHFRSAVDATLAIGDLEGVVVSLRGAVGAAVHCGRADVAETLWAVLPEGRGRPVIRPMFLDDELAMEQRLGSPTQPATAALLDAAKAILGSPVGQDSTAPPRVAAPGPTSPATVLRFADCELDLDMRELRRAGERVHIEPQVYDLLVLLIERRGTAVAKHDILDEVWGDRFVSESALTSRIKTARRATGDDGRTQGIIRTVHGHGYSFVADVEGD